MWWTGRPGVLWFMGSQRVGHDWATELNWTELKQNWNIYLFSLPAPTRNWKVSHSQNIIRWIIKTISWQVQESQDILETLKRENFTGINKYYKWNLWLTSVWLNLTSQQWKHGGLTAAPPGNSRESFYKFKQRFPMKSSGTASLEEPKWSIHQTHFTNNFDLNLAMFGKMRVILEQKTSCFSGC